MTDKAIARAIAGKSVLITGASRGIGAAAARHFAGLGAQVTLVARDAKAIAALADGLNAAGGTARAAPCDVADYAAIAAVVGTARPDILIANAAVIAPIATLGKSDPAEWGRAVDINLKGVYNAARAALPGMLAKGGGTILNLSSGAATSPLEGWSAYCATKAAVLMLTRCLDREYRGRGIRAVGLSPGTVATDMQRTIKASGINPVSQLDWAAYIPPDWVARALAWMCTAKADAHLGGDVSLRSPEIRAAAGLPTG